MDTVRVLIIGIGGVGGYFGGHLADHYADHDEVEVIFMARGLHKEKMKNNGLELLDGSSRIICKPSLITENSSEIGKVDYIIVCTKSSELSATMKSINNCIDETTVIIPLQNGVVSTEIIQQIYPHNLVTYGCAYVISRIVEPGKIVALAYDNRIYFGSDNPGDKRLIHLESILRDAGINAKNSQNIKEIIWEKYIMVAVMATATSYFDENIGEILNDTEKRDLLIRLIHEAVKVSEALQIEFTEDIHLLTLKKFEAMDPAASTSLHHDLKNKKTANELEYLTGYMASKARQFHVETPVLEKMYNYLQLSMSSFSKV
ncbi:ketopantoate reductase family protein [Chryseobacterium aquifrigidense]|uniref:2-dehydropantoate 2-reductase n=1 Tax=Chryseobacterium aquifrigidense TaxID=558021 RepID=A0A543EHL0_9FLAO|nr:2-dehydropantoate 2-reductase [Chryseobacterium aquifrigidense]TQM21078.1 ketopantoate reductase [Chryseobacterium aquifrigidense]